MKAYTDVPQSKRLAEILPLESADMHYSTWTILDGEFIVSPNQGSTIEDLQEDYGNQIIPAWSLATLLDILPVSIYDNTDEYSQLEFTKVSVAYHDINDRIKVGSIKDNLVDACYELILKLHELNLL